ncbi:hypothetical protein [Polaribacter sp. OB-PA-B3]
MKKTIILLTILITTSCGIQKIPSTELHTLEPAKLYETTEDYISNKSVEAGILIKERSNQHIKIKGVFDLNTGIKIKRGMSAWIIEYNGNKYFNLGYSGDVNHWNYFGKLDIEGKYCAIIIDKNSPNILKSSSNNYGGGLAGVLIGESSKWNKNWKDENGEKKKILFIDTENIRQKNANRNIGSLGDYLTRKQLQEITNEIGLNLSDTEIKNIMFEKIIQILKTENNK